MNSATDFIGSALVTENRLGTRAMMMTGAMSLAWS
jgi:hypothetical protein